MTIHDDARAAADAVYAAEFERRDAAARAELEKARAESVRLVAELAASDGVVGELREKLAAAQARIVTLEKLLEASPVEPVEPSPGLFFRLPKKDELVRPNFAFDHGWPFFWESSVMPRPMEKKSTTLVLAYKV